MRAEYVGADTVHKLYWLSGYWYLVDLWLIKVAFLSTYYRVTKHHGSAYVKNWVRKMLHVFSVYIALGFAGCVLLHTLWCRPLVANCSFTVSGRVDRD